MNKRLGASKAIISATIFTSSLFGILSFSSTSMAQIISPNAVAVNSVSALHETHDLNELKNQAYQKMSQTDNPNAMDLADLHHVIFTKDKAQFHDFLVHTSYDKVVASKDYQESNPNSQDLADTMGSLEKKSDKELIDLL